MGWEEDLLQEAADTCTNSSGEQSDCALFTIQDADTYDSCSITLPDALTAEDVTGPVTSIPGNVAIQSGPARATMGTATTTASGSASTTAASGSSLVPTLSYSAGSTIVASLSQSYAVGGVFEAESISTSVAASSSAATITSAPAVTTSSASEEFVSTALWTSGQDAYEVFWVEETVTVTASATETVSPAKKRSDHRHGHARRAAYN